MSLEFYFIIKWQTVLVNFMLPNITAKCWKCLGANLRWAIQFAILNRSCIVVYQAFENFLARFSLKILSNIQIQPSLKVKLAFSFPHVSRAQRLAPARTRTRVVRLGAQCTDHWTTEQSCGVGVPAVQLTTHVKSSTLYGRTVVHPNFFGLMGYYYFV